MAEHKKNASAKNHDKHTDRDAGNKQAKKQEGTGWNHMGKNTNNGNNKNQGNNKKNK